MISKTTQPDLDDPTQVSRGRSRPVQLLLLGTLIGLAAIAIMVGFYLIQIVVPRWVFLELALAFLQALLIAYVATICLASLGAIGSIGLIVREVKWRRRRLPHRLMKVLMLSLGLLVGVGLMEGVSRAIIVAAHRIPSLPRSFPDNSAPQEIDLVVCGESSARGEPYHPWVSAGQIIAWQLERELSAAGKKVNLDMRAGPGLTLEQAVLKLKEMRRKPELMLIYSGHNEFQTPYGWKREVRYYQDEVLESRLALVDFTRSVSNTAQVILENVDKFFGETPPRRQTDRLLVDRPCCTSKEYRDRVDDYRRRLDALLSYCDSIGTIPIVVIPASNDGAFEPNRSVLLSDTPVEERTRFASEFLATRRIESADPGRAIAEYRRLIDGHPEFAEAHYRLAGLLRDRGEWREASAEFSMARDFDGFPLRAPTPFREICREVAWDHNSILVDGPELLGKASPQGILDDRLFSDAQHPSLNAYLILAKDALRQLRERGAIVAKETRSLPLPTLRDCIDHFGIGHPQWSEVIKRSGDFYFRLAYTRYDSTERFAVSQKHVDALRRYDEGVPLDRLGIRAVEVNEELKAGD